MGSKPAKQHEKKEGPKSPAPPKVIIMKANPAVKFTPPPGGVS